MPQPFASNEDAHNSRGPAFAQCVVLSQPSVMLDSSGSIVKIHDFFDNGTSLSFVMDRMHQDLLDGHLVVF